MPAWTVRLYKYLFITFFKALQIKVLGKNPVIDLPSICQLYSVETWAGFLVHVQKSVSMAPSTMRIKLNFSCRLDPMTTAAASPVPQPDLSS
ncbi:MAG: hypothetical protein ABI642_07725 [Polaromonas sp.]